MISLVVRSAKKENKAMLTNYWLFFYEVVREGFSGTVAFDEMPLDVKKWMLWLSLGQSLLGG